MEPFRIDEEIKDKVLELLVFEDGYRKTIIELSKAAALISKEVWDIIKSKHPQATGAMNFNGETLIVSSTEEPT